MEQMPLFLPNLRSKRHQRQLSNLKELLAKWYSNNRATQNHTYDGISNCHRNSGYNQPDNIGKQTNRTATIYNFFPKWAERQPCKFKHCRPIGIPTIVMHHKQPAAIHANPLRNPPQIIHNIFPRNLIIHSLLSLFVWAVRTTKHKYF